MEAEARKELLGVRQVAEFSECAPTSALSLPCLCLFPLLLTSVAWLRGVDMSLEWGLGIQSRDWGELLPLETRGGTEDWTDCVQSPAPCELVAGRPRAGPPGRQAVRNKCGNVG